MTTITNTCYINNYNKMDTNAKDESSKTAEHCNFDLFSALESVYPLLEMVFSNLDYQNLKNVATIKDSWKTIVERVLQKRKKPAWFSLGKDGNLEMSDNLNYTNENFGIVFHERCKINPICLGLISQSTKYCLISCPRVNSHFPGKTQKKTVFDGIIFPHIPNIRTAIFSFNKNTKDINAFVSEQIKENEELQCLLTFSYDSFEQTDAFFQCVLPIDKKGCALGGGLVNGIKIHENNMEQKFSKKDTFCIAFLKEKGVFSEFNAFSFVIKGGNISKQDFEDKLLKFKKSISLRKHSVAFQICCAAKKGSAGEILVFSKVFPNVPILGMDANGEFGVNCVLQVDDDDPEPPLRKTKRAFSVHHAYTTIIVIITWGGALQSS